MDGEELVGSVGWMDGEGLVGSVGWMDGEEVLGIMVYTAFSIVELDQLLLGSAILVGLDMFIQAL